MPISIGGEYHENEYDMAVASAKKTLSSVTLGGSAYDMDLAENISDSVPRRVPPQAPTEVTGALPGGAPILPTGSFSPASLGSVEEDKQADMSSWFNNWLGINPKTKTIEQAPVSKEWPTKEDVGISKLTDRAYADPSEPYFKAGAPRNEVGVNHVLDWYNRDKDFPNIVRPMNQTEANTIHAQWIAAEHSPVSKLGFSPGKMYTTPDADLTVAGAYKAKGDQIWYDSSYTSTPVHESIHRGIEMMRKEGVMPESLKGIREENLVAALMSRHFGDIELDTSKRDKEVINIKKSQIASISKEQLDILEKAAAEYIAKKRPGGPR